MNFSLADMDAIEDYLDYNTSKYFYEDQIISVYTEIIPFSVVLIICCIGVPLNGIVIWLLGFQIKRNPFTVLILNLAIANFGLLVLMTVFSIGKIIHFLPLIILGNIFFSLFHVTYINGLFLLAAICIDRCVCVLFPIWHRHSQPKYLTSVVCVFLWIFSFLLGGILPIVGQLLLFNGIWNLHLVATAVLCLPLIIISTKMLFIRRGLKSQQIKGGRLLMIILITLLCFLILTLPLDIYLFAIHFPKNSNWFDANELDFYLSLSSSLNSSINPVIYFLVGRKKRAWRRESIKVIFQRVFREEEALEI